ncbi:MAG: hypothetical protein V2I67_01060 [Thermoanaerobaculales bacterium]|nr:hypothetical protein [Thermoanaerobaculales bacterium]
MSESIIEVGTIVRHPNRPAWGPGKTLAIGGGGQVTVYFRDIEETKTGDAVKTLATGTVGLEIAAEQSEPMLDGLPPFAKGRFKGVNKPRLSLVDAVGTYRSRQPGALDDPAVRDDVRAPYDEARRMWLDGLGDGKGNELLDDGNIDDARERFLKIAAIPGVLSPGECTSLANALEDDDDAATYLRALFAVTEQTTADQTTYQQLIDIVVELSPRDGKDRSTTWPVLTQFPCIASPEHHIHLKPPTAQRCASRLNYDLRYTAAPNWWTYNRMLDLAKILLARLKPLGAVDFFDVMPFMRVIASA